MRQVQIYPKSEQ